MSLTPPLQGIGSILSMVLVVKGMDGNKYEKTLEIIRHETPEVTCPSVKRLQAHISDFNVTCQVTRFLPRDRQVRWSEG